MTLKFFIKPKTIIYLSMFSISCSSFAYENIEESFIQLSVGKMGNGFYRVMMDEKENPYIEIDSFMKTWFNMDPKCIPEQLYCQINIPEKKGTFVLDGESRKSGEEDKEQDWETSDRIVNIDGKLWLKYDTWNKWIPMTTSWSVRSYMLSVLPNFKLAAQKLTEIEAQRKQEIEKRKIHDKYLKSEAIEPEDKSYSEGRIDLTSTYDEKYKAFDSTLSYDVSVDLKNGTFSAGGEAIENKKDGGLSYWIYENTRYEYLDYIGLGQVYFDGSLIGENMSVENGIRINRLHRDSGTGKFNKQYKAQPNSTIDIYLNGFYQDKVIADNNGYYMVEGLNVKSGDTISFREVSTDGIERNTTQKIAGSEGLFISKGKYDYQIFYGENDGSKFSYTDIKYGVEEHFTLGIQNYSFETNKNNFYQENAQESQFNSILMLWRFNYDLSIEAELGLNENTDGLKANWEISDSQSVTYQTRKIEPGSSMENSDWFNTKGIKYSELNHRWVNGRWQVASSLTKSDENKEYEIQIDKKMNNRISTTANIGYEVDQLNNKSNLIGLKFNKAMSDGGTIESGINYKNKITTFTGDWRLIGRSSTPWGNSYFNRPWTLSTGFQYNKESKFQPKILFNWQQNEWVAGSLSATNTNILATISIKLGISHNKNGDGWNTQSWYNFQQGVVSGTLNTPKINGKSDPVSGVEVQVSNYKAITDSEGKYTINGIPANEDLTMFLNESTLDIRLTQKEESQKINLRPGTRLNINPELVWTVGMDGTIIGVDPKKGYILEFKNMDSKKLKDIPVESDGFFIAEKLVPGKYKLYLKLKGKTIKEWEYEVEETDWISDAIFKI